MKRVWNAIAMAAAIVALVATVLGLPVVLVHELAHGAGLWSRVTFTAALGALYVGVIVVGTAWELHLEREASDARHAAADRLIEAQRGHIADLELMVDIKRECEALDRAAKGGA